MIISWFSYTDHNFNIWYQSVFALEMSFRLTYPENYVSSTTKSNTSSICTYFAEKYLQTVNYLEMINLRILSYDVIPWGVTVDINHPVGFLRKEDSKWKHLLGEHIASLTHSFFPRALWTSFPFQFKLSPSLLKQQICALLRARNQ